MQRLTFGDLFYSLSLCTVNIYDVTKLVKIRIRRMRISTFKIRGMRIEAFILSVRMQCTRLGKCKIGLNDCNHILFPKVNTISVQISTV